MILAADNITWTGNTPNVSEYWLLSDPQNTVRDVVSVSTRSITASFDYDDFGKPTNLAECSDAMLKDLARHQGRPYDRDTKLFDNRARMYNPVSHTFTGEDPITIASGESNFYRSCKNSPQNYTDPTGMFWNEFFGAMQVVGGVFQVAGGAAIIIAGVATEAPTLGASTLAVLGGGLIAFKGLDNIQAGFRRCMGDADAHTITYDMVKSFTGSDSYALGVDIGTDLLSFAPESIFPKMATAGASIFPKLRLAPELAGVAGKSQAIRGAIGGMQATESLSILIGEGLKMSRIGGVANAVDKLANWIFSKSSKDNKPYADPTRRPQYADGQVEDVWENAVDENGIVRCPRTGKILTWDKTKPRNGQWDMGHIENFEYRHLHKDYMDDKITLEEFLRRYRDPANYRPEWYIANRAANQ